MNMALCNDNLRNYVLDVLNKLDTSQRCAELSLIFARSNLRDLQDIFPIVVHSIFGVGPNGLGVGWGLRTTVQNAGNNNSFESLNDFLHPTGPMMMLCYRLLNDAIKFEFDFNLLPRKVSESIRTGHCSQFYSDLVNVDPVRRQITSLSLNAFDFYILHFIIHGTLALHKIHPAALYVHNECTKTAYFFLCADYLCNFLPSGPDSAVLPTNVCATVKTPIPMPVLQPLKPQRSPKFLKIPNLNMYSSDLGSITTSPTATNSSSTIESPRTYAWRSETVLNLFIDIWLRYDIDEVRDLPGSEFVRVVRLLIKQAHTFANSAHSDHTAMALLRKQAQPMIKVRIYSFLKSIIDRWPLDGSLIVVVELWLSYIQPWRYRYELRRQGVSFAESLSLQGFEDFIAENLIAYTQIFAFVLARFERLDFTLLGNASMLYRVVKVFSQQQLPLQLAQSEAAYLSNNVRNLDSPQRRMGQYARYTQFNQSMSSSDSTWDPSKFYHDDTYTPLFGSAMQTELEMFVRSLNISRKYVQQEILNIHQGIQAKKNSVGYVKRFIDFFMNESSPVNEKLQKLNDVPELLNASMRGLSFIFNIDLQHITMEDYQTKPEPNQSLSSAKLGDISSGYLDMSTLSPIKMRNNVTRMRATVDPALYPIQSYECAILVRLLHEISTTLNQLFSEKMLLYWNRNDVWGRLTRFVLYPPMTAQWFDKPRGINELCEQQLPPRLILRPLGSYKFLIGLTFFLIGTYVFWNPVSYGITALFILLFLFLFIKILT